MNFGARLKQAREKKGWSQGRLAEAAGLPADSGQQTIAAIERRDSSRSDYAQQLCDALGLDLRYALTGKPMEVSEPPVEYKVVEAGDPNFQWVSKVVGASLSAGVGAMVWDIDEKDNAYAFQTSWLQAAGLDARHCKAWTVRGDSMEPRYQDGGLLLIDMRDRTPRHGKSYALVGEDGLRVKQLHRSKDGWVMHSLNPDKSRYPDEPIVDESYVILGRVRAFMGQED